MDVFNGMFRLASGPADSGLYCGKGELTLGGVSLLVRNGSRLNPRPTNELKQIFDAAYGIALNIDIGSCRSALAAIARALDKGDLALATITSLMLRLPNLDPTGMARLSKTEILLKAGFNSLEPRNAQGRWSGDGSSPVLPVGWTVTMPVPGPPILFPELGGTPRPKDDDFVFPPYPPQVGAHQGANDNAATNTQTAVNDNRPLACPDPSYEPDSVNRTREQLLYQAQINKLPIGWHVILNGVGYDGCRASDQFMLEGKSGNDWFLQVPEFIRPTFKEYKDTMAQAERQNNNSGGRYIEWHFANKDIANYWQGEFFKANLLHIFVIYTPYDEHYNYNLIRFDSVNNLGSQVRCQVA
jgi:hypothetical protein